MHVPQGGQSHHHTISIDDVQLGAHIVGSSSAGDAVGLAVGRCTAHVARRTLGALAEKPDQLAAIPLEAEPGEQPPTAAALLVALRVAVDAALNEYRVTSPDVLSEARRVGRAGLPSTVQGLLFHAADHAMRHAGQVVATAKIITGLGRHPRGL